MTLFAPYGFKVQAGKLYRWQIVPLANCTAGTIQPPVGMYPVAIAVQAVQAVQQRAVLLCSRPARQYSFYHFLGVVCILGFC
jgi:hypothetical protein